MGVVSSPILANHLSQRRHCPNVADAAVNADVDAAGRSRDADAGAGKSMDVGAAGLLDQVRCCLHLSPRTQCC